MTHPTFDEDQALCVLTLMEQGLSLRKSCKQLDLAPSVFLRWVDDDRELQEHYVRARARLLDVHAEELEEIGERAAKAKTSVEVQGLRLQSDNRKWLLSKLAPKRYGEKIEHTGELGIVGLAQRMRDRRPITLDVTATVVKESLAALPAHQETTK